MHQIQHVRLRAREIAFIEHISKDRQSLAGRFVGVMFQVVRKLALTAGKR
jgi:hypothetical protein